MMLIAVDRNMFEHLQGQAKVINPGSIHNNRQ